MRCCEIESFVSPLAPPPAHCPTCWQVHHRIFICDPSKSANVAVNGEVVVMNILPGSEKADATAMRPTNVIAQADVVSLLQQNQAALGDVVNTKVEDLHMFMVSGSQQRHAASGVACHAAGSLGRLCCCTGRPRCTARRTRCPRP